jgi:hypothetical protein
MPGPVSDPSPGTPDDAPYVPSWCYPNGEPQMCPCGHHEGYHDSDGVCLFRRYDFRTHTSPRPLCTCKGLQREQRTAFP